MAMLEWHVWDAEYPEEGSLIVVADDEEHAMEIGEAEFMCEAGGVGVCRCGPGCPCVKEGGSDGE